MICCLSSLYNGEIDIISNKLLLLLCKQFLDEQPEELPLVYFAKNNTYNTNYNYLIKKKTLVKIKLLKLTESFGWDNTKKICESLIFIVVP